MKFITKISCFAILSMLLAFFYTEAQVSFTNSNSQFQGATHSGCSVTVVDVNGDGLDDIVRLDQGHNVYIDYQQPGQQFTHNHIGDFGGGSGWAWGMCVADVDHNGFKDVVAGGYGPAVELLLIDNTGLSGTIVDLPNSDFFVQNINFMDVNNDGWEDLFMCDDNAPSHIFLNDGSGNLNESTTMINLTVHPGTSNSCGFSDPLDAGNYGSVWTDFDNDGDVDLYIAKCRQCVGTPDDSRRWDVLFVNDGSSNYSEDALSYSLRDSGQTWTTNFADIDNDGDLDVIQTDYDVSARLLENDGTGHMTNISAGSGFDISDIYPIESQMEDFDNDGFVDILVTGDHADFFHNNGDHTFTKLLGLFDGNNMKSFASGDLNHDGKIDIYSSYATGYTTPSNVDDVYWLNNTSNGNHFITFNLIGTTSTEGALGARVTLYGPWGKQVREVHAGESYGTCNSTNLHFGLGAATTIDSAVVHWPSGTVTSIISPSADQFITMKEGGCVSPDFTITANGPFILCPGQTLTLTAESLPIGYTYLWSDNSTSQSITVSDGGTYYVTAVSANDVCSVTNAVNVEVSPDQTPVITAAGDLIFCEGGSVTLTCSGASSYLWSNGDTTQSTSVSEPGSYWVTIEGTCQEWTSASVNVSVLASTAPVTTGATITQPGNATVTATGNNISWYDVPTGGVAVATGNSYTMYITATDTFYAEDQVLYADTFYTGQKYHHGSSYSGSGSTNAITFFDVLGPCTLKSAKVYTDFPGNRLVELRDAGGNTIQSTMVNVPVDTNRVTLNFNLTPGSYQLGTNAAQNQILLNTDGPHLERSSQGVDYPYVLNDLVSINNSDQGPFYYYYFYDWEVLPAATVCVSARTPAIVLLTTGVESTISSSQFELFPNPSPGLVTIASDAAMSGKVKMEVADIEGKILLSRTEDGMKSGEQIHLDLSQFPKGIYFLNIESGANTMQHKIVIQ
ncbi:MAG TPA: FG-GAP-like repeat-containing protein [Chitinophagales bacterium]|nr:FG-GAP-like repeat-containing protein [Chitinophagales bacterium]